MELQIRENEMSEQVDKATFRALTAEKKLQEAGFENEIEKLQVRRSRVDERPSLGFRIRKK